MTLTLRPRNLSTTLEPRIAHTLLSRNPANTLYSRIGLYLPSLIRLPDDGGYWLFGDSSRIMWGAGDVGTGFSLRPRSIALTLPEL